MVIVDSKSVRESPTDVMGEKELRKKKQDYCSEERETCCIHLGCT